MANGSVTSGSCHSSRFPRLGTHRKNTAEITMIAAGPPTPRRVDTPGRARCGRAPMKSTSARRPATATVCAATRTPPAAWRWRSLCTRRDSCARPTGPTARASPAGASEFMRRLSQPAGRGSRSHAPRQHRGHRLRRPRPETTTRRHRPLGARHPTRNRPPQRYADH